MAPEADLPAVPAGDYMMREHYCSQPGCDCRRVLVHIHAEDFNGPVLASVSYAFDAPAEDDPLAGDMGQVFLDPLNPQSLLSEALLELFWSMISTDPEYRARLERHHEMVKAVVDDDEHPPSRQVRSQPPSTLDDVIETLARGPVRRQEPKVGRNEPCPCGSGQKYKRCCGRHT